MDIAMVTSYRQAAGGCVTKTKILKQFQVNEICDPNAEKEEQVDPKNCSLYKWGVDDGMKFSVLKANSYTEDNPIMMVRGIDQCGDKFEQMFDPREIDPENASFTEFAALCMWLSQSEEYDAFQFGDLEYRVDDIFEKHNYLNVTRDKRDEQIRYGDMAAYHNTLNVCSAVSNFVLDQNSKTEYIETAYGRKKAYLVDIGTKDNGLGTSISLGVIDGVGIYAAYAEDSTRENPIVEVHVREEETEKEETYRVPINDINPRYATQMEIFALCAHYDRQKGAADPCESGFAPLKSSYYAGFTHDFFTALTVEEFVSEKHDWCNRLEEVSKRESILNADSKSWISIFEELFEAYMDEQDFEESNEEITEQALQSLFEDRTSYA